ncbi:unnamed protein product, partial [Aphanomyces euteiches]
MEQDKAAQEKAMNGANVKKLKSEASLAMVSVIVAKAEARQKTFRVGLTPEQVDAELE